MQQPEFTDAELIHEEIRAKLHVIPGFPRDWEEPFSMLSDNQQRLMQIVADVVRKRNDDFRETLREKLKDAADEIKELADTF